MAEGVRTVQAVKVLAERHEVEMPISQEVHAMLVSGRSLVAGLAAVFMGWATDRVIVLRAERATRRG